MPVPYDQRTLPLAANASKTEWSNNVTVAWDFTGIGSLAEGEPWKYTGATKPTLVKSGTQTLSTLAGEPGRVASTSSNYDYTNLTDFGFQVGSGDFTLAFRFSTPGTVPPASVARVMARISGTAGNSIQLSITENPGVGWYLVATGSTSCPFGSTLTPMYFAPNQVGMVFLQRIGGIARIYTANVTTQSNAQLRYNAGAAATTNMDSTWAARLLANSSTSVANGVALQAIKFWNVGLSTSVITDLAKDFWNSEANSAVADSIAITSPTASSSIAGSSVISGTYVGTAPTGVEVQFGANAWVAGSGMTIGSGAWSGSFALTAGGPSTLQARESNAPAIVSPTIASITVTANTIAFTGSGITTDEAVPYRMYQRDGSNNAIARIKGTYSGSPTALQYSWNGSAWATLVASPTGGAFNTTVVLAGPAQGALSVRFANDTAVVGTMTAVGVGDIYIVAGQSNHVGGGAGTYVPPVAPGSNPGWLATILDKTGRWRPNYETVDDPFSKTTNATPFPSASSRYTVQGLSATAYNSYFGKLATLFMATGIPVAFVPCARGSTSVQSWEAGTATNTLYGAMLAVAQGLNDHKAVLWWQGEFNTEDGTTRSTHEALLAPIIADWCGTRFPGKKWVLMNINATGNPAGSGGTGASDTGFNAIHAAIAAVGDASPYVYSVADMNGAFSSSVHYAYAPEIDEIAARAYAGMNASLVHADVSCGYSITQEVGAALAGSYGINGLVHSDLFCAYAIGSALTLVSADLAGSYAIQNLVSADIFGDYSVLSPDILVSAELTGSYAINAFVSASLICSYAISSSSTLARAPSGDGYRPSSRYRQSRPADIQGYKR